ncbi:MAG: hypothetical protein ACR2JP_11670 [Acidimicrobiia bacterium]
MPDQKQVEVLVAGSLHHVNTMASRPDGGSVLTAGITEIAARRYPAVRVDLDVEIVAGFDELRRRLEAGSGLLGERTPDVVILSVDDEVRRLGSRGPDPASAVEAVRGDLVALTGLFKAAGVRVLVANACTVDPESWPRTYAGLDQEPVGLRAHRLDVMLIEVSHTDGISVIDVDRAIAELGATGRLDAAMVYGAEACERIAEDTVSVLEDYGFLDDRPLLEQVGAGSGGA